MAWFGGWRSVVLSGLVASMSGCGPDTAVPQGSLDGGSGGEGEMWEPDEPLDPDGEEVDVPGPETLAMAHEDDQDRLVSLGAGGSLAPYGPLLPPAAADMSFRILEWKPEVGRGAVLRRSETESNVVFIDHEQLTVVQHGAPLVNWIYLSREAQLVVLHHEDDATTVVDRNGTVVLQLEPRPSGRHNWLGFGDGDRWVIWSRDVEPSNPFSDLDYWFHDFDTGRTRPFVTWPTGSGAQLYTFGNSVLRQHDDHAPQWVNLDGRSISADVPLEALTFGPRRYVFTEDRAYQLRDGGELEDLGPHVHAPGYIHRFEPGRYLLIETEEQLAYFDPQGNVLHEISIANAQDISVGPFPDDPNDLSIVVTFTHLIDGVSERSRSLWRPGTVGPEDDPWVRFGFVDPDNDRTFRFAPDGSLISLYDDDSLTVLLPGAEDEVPVVSDYVLEGFHYTF